MKLLRALPLLLVLFAACDKKKDSLCDRYADLEVRCGGYGEGARGIATSTCEKAQKPGDDVMLKMIKIESACALPDTDCDAYKACVEKAKAENSPFD